MSDMTADRELEGLAAKAAGLWDHANNCIDIPWGPLTSDGDALRLAVKLRIDIEWQNVGALPTPEVEAYRRSSDGEGYFCASEPEADYRRAIVRAAAEIGRKMP